MIHQMPAQAADAMTKAPTGSKAYTIQWDTEEERWTRTLYRKRADSEWKVVFSGRIVNQSARGRWIVYHERDAQNVDTLSMGYSSRKEPEDYHPYGQPRF